MRKIRESLLGATFALAAVGCGDATSASSVGAGGAATAGGGPSTGGVSTGGAPSTGGVSTGGTPSTGGVSTGGTATTGGVSTGGTATTGGSPSTGGNAGSAGSSEPLPSSGCGVAPPASGEQSITVEELERTYLLDLPPSYDSNTAYPLVFGFHGAGTSGSLFRSNFYGNLLSTMGDFAIVVHPDAGGEDAAWNTTRDVPYFDAMLARLTAELCVDEERIFATGHSSGGFFTNTLGCQRGDVLRAIAPVSGGGPQTFGGSGCMGEVAAWIAHGENDETVDFESGEGSRDHWLEANGCGSATTPATPEECVDYADCMAGLPVRWCVYQDGHDWPSFGATGMWSFFQGF